MVRDHLFHKTVPADPMFRWRGGQVSRLEALSDGVFAVTLTLLIVAVDVPRTYYELWLTIRDLPTFLFSFLMLMMAWRYHYIFFRRYGLENFLTQVLNGAFLFLILFYAYPLKFLATYLWSAVRGDWTAIQTMFALPAGVQWSASASQGEGLMIFYGLGVFGVFAVLALMSAYALRCRRELELDELEICLTRGSVRAHLISAGIAAASMLLVAVGAGAGAAGLTYFAMGPVHAVHGFWTGARADRIHRAMQASAGEGEPDAVA